MLSVDMLRNPFSDRTVSPSAYPLDPEKHQRTRFIEFGVGLVDHGGYRLPPGWEDNDPDGQ